MKKILILIWIIFISFVIPFISISKAWEDEESGSWCEEWSIKLNTNVPWVWKCIKKENAQNTFWSLMWWLIKLALNLTIAASFIALIASGIMISISWLNQNTAWKWKEMLKKVILWIALIWISGIILNTINPNFFTNESSESNSEP